MGGSAKVALEEVVLFVDSRKEDEWRMNQGKQGGMAGLSLSEKSAPL